MNRQVTLSRELLHFVKKYADDYYTVKLLFFFATYPFARFSRPAIVPALEANHGRHHAHLALDRLVEQGVISTCVDNDTALYWLAKDNATRRLVLQLGKLAMSQRQLLLETAARTN